jgi:phage terminase large subunit-like protein
MTEWRLSLWGRVRVLFTGRIVTTVWCDKNPPMAVEHDWPNAEADRAAVADTVTPIVGNSGGAQ